MLKQKGIVASTEKYHCESCGNIFDVPISHDSSDDLFFKKTIKHDIPPQCPDCKSTLTQPWMQI